MACTGGVVVLGDVYTTSPRGDGGCFVGLVKEPLEKAAGNNRKLGSRKQGFYPNQATLTHQPLKRVVHSAKIFITISSASITKMGVCGRHGEPGRGV